MPFFLIFMCPTKAFDSSCDNLRKEVSTESKDILPRDKLQADVIDDQLLVSKIEANHSLKEDKNIPMLNRF